MHIHEVTEALAEIAQALQALNVKRARRLVKRRLAQAQAQQAAYEAWLEGQAAPEVSTAECPW
jgi:predicted transcriptional regulator